MVAEKTFDIKNIDEIFVLGSSISRVLNPNNIYPIDIKKIIRAIGGIILYESFDDKKTISKIKKLNDDFDDDDFNFQITLNSRNKSIENIDLAVQLGNIFIQMGYYDDRWNDISPEYVDTIDTYEHAESIQFALSFLMPTAEFYNAIKTFSENREMKTDLSQVCKYFGVTLSDVVFYGRNLGVIKD